MILLSVLNSHPGLLYITFSFLTGSCCYFTISRKIRNRDTVNTKQANNLPPEAGRQVCEFVLWSGRILVGFLIIFRSEGSQSVWCGNFVQ